MSRPTRSDERVRLFVAVDVPRDLLRAANEAVRGAAASLPSGRWTREDGQHVTLKFLGWTRASDIPRVGTALARVAGRHAPARISLQGVGAFPSARRARVLWLGLDDPSGLLTRLAGDLDAALEPLGFEREQRAFTPHLTLARFKAPTRIDDLVPPLPARPFEVTSVRLYRSLLHPAGARYEALQDHPLQERP